MDPGADAGLGGAVVPLATYEPQEHVLYQIVGDFQSAGHTQPFQAGQDDWAYQVVDFIGCGIGEAAVHLVRVDGWQCGVLVGHGRFAHSCLFSYSL